MQFFSNFDNFLNEKLKISQVRNYILQWKKIEGDKRYADWFGGKNRIIIDLHDKSFTQKSVEEHLLEQGYEVIDYFDNVAKKKNDLKNSFKITKILQRFYPTLLPIYNSDKEKGQEKNDEYKIVISRHPYDLAGMSTDRSWTSCMDLNSEDTLTFSEHISDDIIEGSIIAYLVRKDDSNINNPIARVLIKPFVNVTNPEHVILATDKKVYGNDVSGFKDTVDDWLKEKQGVVTTGFYKLKDTLYDDGKSVVTTGDHFSQYVDIRPIYFGYIVKDKYYKYGLIDKKFNEVIPCEYIQITNFNAIDIVKVKKEVDDKGLFGLISITGEVLVEPQYHNIRQINPFLASVKDANNKFGIITVEDAKITIQPKYDKIEGANFTNTHMEAENFALCTISGIKPQMALVDQNGIEIVPPIYLLIEAYKHFFIIGTEKGCGAISQTGEILIECSFSYAEIKKEIEEKLIK